MRRTVALTLAMLMLTVALMPVPVIAQGQGGGGAVIPINTTDFTGNLTIRSFALISGTLTAIGTVAGTALTGPNAGMNFVRAVRLPVIDITQPTAGVCEILSLVLGPLHLDLLGLVVDLNQVVLNITGETGPGNLLGNLLCAIAGLLDPGPGLASNVQQLLSLLNRVLGQL